MILRSIDVKQSNLLVKKYLDSVTYYVLASNLIENFSNFDANMSDLPEELQCKIAELGAKPRVEKLQLVLLWLCSLRSYRAEILAIILQRQVTGPKSLHLSRLYNAKLLDYLYPEVIHHPQQAYQTTGLG